MNFILYLTFEKNCLTSYLQASADWWRLRCLFVHQQVLEERSPVIYNQLTALLQRLSQSEKVAASSAVQTLLHLETASIWIYYGYVLKAQEALTAAARLKGVNISLVGMLGLAVIEN